MIGDSQRIERIDALLCDLPVVGPVFCAGSRDPIYDLLMVTGPLLLLLIRLLGRGIVTQGLTFLYLLSFVAYLGYKYAREKR